MNHFAFRAAMILIVVYLVAVAAAGFWMHPRYPDTYATFKDMLPVLIAIAAAALTGYVQRRAFLPRLEDSMDNA
jgi:hypothetical protein